MDAAEALAFQPAQRAIQSLLLLADDMRTEIPVGARLVPVVRHALRHVDYDGHR